MARAQRYLIVTAVLVTVTAVLTASNSKVEPECVRAARWVEQNPADVPVTLEGLAAIPRVYARAAFKSLSPEKKSQLWQTHLRRYLAQYGSTLSSEQKKFVHMSIEMATPQLYRDAVSGRSPSAQIEHNRLHAAIREQARQLFSVTERRVFVQLGYKTVLAAQSVPPSLRGISLIDAPACDCEVGDNWCAFTCRDLGRACYDDGSGCGFLNCGPCNGMCD